MASNNNNPKWLLWGFIILAILNIILLGYIVMGLSGKNVGLSPIVNAGPDLCNDGKPETVCWIGDILGDTQLQIKGSKIREHASDSQLQILSDKAGGIKLSGIKYNGQNPPTEIPTIVNINGDLSVSKARSTNSFLIPSTLTGYANMINKDAIEINNTVRATAIKTGGICFYTANALTVFCKVNPLVTPPTFSCELTEPALPNSPCYRNPTGNIYTI